MRMLGRCAILDWMRWCAASKAEHRARRAAERNFLGENVNIALRAVTMALACIWIAPATAASSASPCTLAAGQTCTIEITVRLQGSTCVFDPIPQLVVVGKVAEQEFNAAIEWRLVPTGDVKFTSNNGVRLASRSHLRRLDLSGPATAASATSYTLPLTYAGEHVWRNAFKIRAQYRKADGNYALCFPTGPDPEAVIISRE
jgi:hypothetical protein